MMANMEFEEKNLTFARPRTPQIFVAINFFFGAAILGMSIAHSAVLLPGLQSGNANFTIDEDLGSWIVSVYSIVGPLGALLGGIGCDVLGRKRTHIIADFCMLLGWILITCAQNGYMILFARILEGLARSMASTAVTVLADEISDAKFRGLMLCGMFASGSIGILVMSIFGAFFDWRIASGLVAGLSLLLLIMFCFICESPTWLISVNQNKRAEQVLRRLWGPGHEDKAKEEFTNLKMRLNKQETSSATSTIFKRFTGIILVLFKPHVMKPFLIMHFFNAIQTFCGMNLFTFYTIDILSKVAEYGVDIVDIYYSNIIISGLRTAAILLSCYLIFSMGRRNLALTSGIVSFVPAIIVGFLLNTNKRNEVDQVATLQEYITYILIMVYTVGMSLGFYILPCIMLGETQYYKIRGLICGYVYTINDLLLGIMLKLYPWLLATFDIYGIFFMFGISCAVCTIFVYFFIPETQGLSLQQIEDYFRQNNIMWTTRKKFSNNHLDTRSKEDLDNTKILLK